MTRTLSLDLAHSDVDHEFGSSDEAGLIGCHGRRAAAISLDQPNGPAERWRGPCRRPADRCAMDGLVDGATLDSRRYHTALALGH